MIESFSIPSEPPEVTEEEIQPQIKVIEAHDTYGKFVIEPLERGYGITIGTPLRRVLLSSIPGTAVTWIKIDGVLHEYSTIPNVKEEVMEILLNIKGIRIRSSSERPGKLRLEVNGEGRVCAGDISTSSDFQIVNPESHILTLDSPESTLSFEFNVEHGKGYQPAGHDEGLPVGVLPVDAVFNPVRKVNYSVERTRVGQVTDYERLVIEVWTDNTISAMDALQKASETLVSHFFLCGNVGKEPEVPTDGRALAQQIPIEIYQTPIEKLELSPRTLNCLKRAHINKVGEVLERPKEDLLKIRNFGEKSLHELYDKLREMDLLPQEEETPEAANGDEPQDDPNEEPET